MAKATWGPGKDFQSTGPIKTVAQLRKVARELLAHTHAGSVMAALANLALNHPDVVMARPRDQTELLDMHRRYVTAERKGRFGNPGKSAAFTHKRLKAPGRFARRSFRVTKERKGVRVVVGKLKGERRRVRRGARKGRPVLTAQAVLKRKRNAPAYSEKKAWAAVHKIAARLAGSQVSAAVQEEGYALRELAGAMLEQLGRGVHINPMLAVFGANPPRRVVTGSDDVQGILYRHKEDGRDYVHPFGHGVKVKNNRDGSTVIRAAANARSGVRAIGLSDGSVLLRHPTKPIWKDF